MGGKFKVNLHPRGKGGRFIETPDAPTKEKTKPAKPLGAGRRKTKGEATRSQIEAALLEVRAELGSEQRRRLGSIMAARAEKIKSAPLSNKLTKEQGNKVTKGSDSKNLVGGAKDIPLTSDSPVKVRVKRSKTKLSITESGVHTEVKHHESFKVSKGAYEYKVTHEGRELTLNRFGVTMEYGGYKVRGVPDVLPDLKKVKTPELIDKLATAKRMTSKGNAPQWSPERHGSVDPELVGKRKANPGVPHYGVMQIHHVNQWALDPANNIKRDLKEGKIDNDTAVRRFTDTIERRPTTALKGKVAEVGEGAEDSGAWQLKLAPKEQREFVVLAGGLHQGGTPLYLANHSSFLDPDTGKFKPIGIPHTGEGSREWFNKEFRKPFWKEYAKNQVTVLGRELDRRVKRGDITVAEAKRLLQVAEKNAEDGKTEW